jgi:aryl-alcohol dehydrogenase-like predicted oxidoreductase
VDLGVNFFDTADAYALGGSEEALAEALGASRRDVIIATKVGVNWETRQGAQRARTFVDLRPERVKHALEASLRRLKLDAIPLYLLHWPDKKTPLEDTIDVIERAQKEGKVLNFGVSNFSVSQIREANAILRICAVQIQYNLIDKSAESEIIPCCKELSIGMVVYGPLAQGLLTGKYTKVDKFDTSDRRSRLPHFQNEALDRHMKLIERMREISRREGGKSVAQIALRWLLDKGEVSSVITGAKTPRQIEDNVGSLGWHLSEADAQYLAGMEE